MVYFLKWQQQKFSTLVKIADDRVLNMRVDSNWQKIDKKNSKWGMPPKQLIPNDKWHKKKNQNNKVKWL